MRSSPPPRSVRPWAPGQDAAAQTAAREAYLAAGGDPADEGALRLVETVGEHAPALLPLVVGRPGLPRVVLARPLTLEEDPEDLRRRIVEETRAAGPEDFFRVLREARHRGVLRIALREALRLADVDRTSAEIAHLAAAVIDAALAGVSRDLAGEHGVARDASGAPIPFTVLGMGKLGGGELNIGSDVDLCFFYGTDEGEVEGGALTVHAYFAKLATRLVRALSEVTEDGFCFRVDLRLRPEGSRGALVNSLASAERYYETWGRTWERAVLLRAEAIAGDRAFGGAVLEALRPFVFRREVNPAAAAEMASMLERTRRELRVDDVRDIKLGRGGIREAEFFVQALQLVWGGRHPSVQVPGTVEAVRRLRAAGLVSDREMTVLERDWALLRRVEHRLHVHLGYQTHTLPAPGAALDRLARSLAFSGGAELMATITEARARVSELFGTVATDAPSGDAFTALADALASDEPNAALIPRAVEALRLTEADAAEAHLGRLRRRADSPFGRASRERFPTFAPAALREVADAANPDGAVRSLADFFARAGDAGPFLKIMADSPRLLRRLISLFGSSPTLSDALVQHPESLAQVALGNVLDADAIRAEHAALRAAHPASDDPEPLVHALRRVKRETTLALGFGVTSGEIDARTAELRLTVLAEEQVSAALAVALDELTRRYGDPLDEADQTPARLVALGMGSLAAREVSFGSDLDLVFVFDRQGVAAAGRAPITASEFFTRVVQRAMGLLSQPDAEGEGYETDARLRPDGSQGTLVVSFDAFRRYHERHAEGWERQALLRARVVGGDPRFGGEVESLLGALLAGAQPPARARVAEIRGRMQTERARERPGRYHAKAGFGTLADVEFLVQTLVLEHGLAAATEHGATVAALAALRRAQHLPDHDADTLLAAYRFFRDVDLALRLARPGADATLLAGTRDAERIARQLRIRDRGGETEGATLERTWREHAYETRALFERWVAPVGIGPGWATAGV